MPVQQAVYVRDDGISSTLFALPDFAPPPDDFPGTLPRRLDDGDLAAWSRRPGQGAGTRPALDDGGRDERPQRIARMITEALAGSRPARQVLPWTSNRARRQLQRMRASFGEGQRPRIVRILSTHPAPGVIEMSVIAGFGPRTRALALRLELPPGAARGAGWICTEIEAALSAGADCLRGSA